MTRWGTSHFVSKAKAIRYFGAYEADPPLAVELKLAEGSIHIGKPDLKPGERLYIVDNGTRYAIESDDQL